MQKYYCQNPMQQRSQRMGAKLKTVYVAKLESGPAEIMQYPT